MEPSMVGGTRALADAASQLLLRVAAATVIGTAPSHDGAVIVDGSSVQCCFLESNQLFEYRKVHASSLALDTRE